MAFFELCGNPTRTEAGTNKIEQLLYTKEATRDRLSPAVDAILATRQHVAHRESTKETVNERDNKKTRTTKEAKQKELARVMQGKNVRQFQHTKALAPSDALTFRHQCRQRGKRVTESKERIDARQIMRLSDDIPPSTHGPSPATGTIMKR